MRSQNNEGEQDEKPNRESRKGFPIVPVAIY